MIAPYLTSIRIRLTDADPCTEVVVMKAAQLGFSQMAVEWARESGAVIVTADTELAERFAEKRAPGVTVLGADAHVDLAAYECVVLDEIDRFPVAWPLPTHARKLLVLGTPHAAPSRIEELWLGSDRCSFFVACPLCGERQVLKVERAVGPLHTPGPGYHCPACAGLVPEHAKPGMLAGGDWLPGADSERHGYVLNAACSPFLRWQDLAKRRGDAEAALARHRVFENTMAARAYRNTIRVASSCSP